MSAWPQPDCTVYAVGLLCPVPLVRTGRAIATLESGGVLELIADDRGVLVDIPDWCTGHGHVYLGHRTENRTYHLFVMKR